MPLLPDVEPGLWVNRDYPAQTSGVYALIIGVSRYDHLLEGGDPAPDAYGLGQLSASALTAYKFFSWLRDVYTLDGRPVVRARLLMSPLRKGVGRVLADELENCEAAICAHAPEATFGNCRTAIENWYAEMQMLRASASGRSLFFFSGHGLELRQNYQVLLPSNWLRPPNQPRDEAISTRNLIDCLPYLAGVSSHVLLIDGCRNDLDKLRGTSLTGMAILNEELPYAVNPQFEKAVLYSTASGLRAYSPKVGSLSLFGQALLEGLNNKADPVLDEAPIELNRKSNRYTVEINKLASYMKGRVAALIKAANESVVQVVRSEVASPDPNRPIELAEIPFNLAKAEDTDRFGRKILAKDVMKVLVTQFLRSQPSLSALSLTAYDADDGISQVYAGERVIVGGKPGSDETVNGRSFTWVFVEAIAGPQSETRKGFVLAELLGPGDVEVPSPGAFEPFSTRKTREDFAETCYFQATRNGTNPAYLYALAFALSGDQWSATEVKTNDPRDAPAFGVFRFPTDTWQILLADLKAEDITLEQIKFPDAQCVVAAMLAAKSARLLKTITDRGPSAVDLLLAHLCADTRLFGSEAAAKILQAEQTNVLQPAEFIFRSIYPDVARRAAFFKRTASIFNGDGSATIGEVLSRCATKMEMGFDEVRKLADAVFGARIPSDAVDPRLLPSVLTLGSDNAIKHLYTQLRLCQPMLIGPSTSRDCTPSSVRRR